MIARAERTARAPDSLTTPVPVNSSTEADITARAPPRARTNLLARMEPIPLTRNRPSALRISRSRSTGPREKASDLVIERVGLLDIPPELMTKRVESKAGNRAECHDIYAFG